MRAVIHIRRLSLSVTLALAGVCGTAAAQQPSPSVKMQPIGYKDPQLATLLGVLITGGGQLYTGRTGKGALLLVGSIASVAVALHGAQSTCGVGASCGSSGAETAGIVAAVALWGYGWATAAHDADLHNEQLLNEGSVTADIGINACDANDIVRRDGADLRVTVYQDIRGFGGCREAKRCTLRDAALQMTNADAVRACWAEAKRD